MFPTSGSTGLIGIRSEVSCLQGASPPRPGTFQEHVTELISWLMKSALVERGSRVRLVLHTLRLSSRFVDGTTG